MGVRLPVTPTIEILQTQTGSRGKETMGCVGVEGFVGLWPAAAAATPPEALAQMCLSDVCCSHKQQ